MPQHGTFHAPSRCSEQRCVLVDQIFRAGSAEKPLATPATIFRGMCSGSHDVVCCFAYLCAAFGAAGVRVEGPFLTVCLFSVAFEAAPAACSSAADFLARHLEQ